MKIDQHPTVLGHRPPKPPRRWTAEELRRLALESGADDAGVVATSRPEWDADREDLETVYPWARSAISLVVRMHREPVRSPARSAANLEFHHAGEEVNAVARKIVRRLENDGVRAANPAMGFPLEMSRFPGKIWTVSHKRIAEAAGLGKMGVHRNLIHPKFGNFVLLGTVLLDVEIDEQAKPLDFNPCLECKLCVAACPVGAISPKGEFHFSACYTHNYREFMGGFTTWVEQVADSRDAGDYRSKVTDDESASWWQSLSYGANYKAAYCLAVCPAGEDVISPFLKDRKGHMDAVLRPLQAKQERIYVVPGSDAEAHVAKRFPHKQIRHVPNSLRPATIDGLLDGMPLTFQAGASKGLDLRIHFTFFGDEAARATVRIRDQQIAVSRVHEGEADLHVTADSQTWLGFLRKDHGLVWALLRRKIRVQGDPRLLLRFGRCFPG